jgi:hypothetical protein
MHPPMAWYRYLDKCKVLASPVWEGLSDRNPVVATLAAASDDALPHSPSANRMSTLHL